MLLWLWAYYKNNILRDSRNQIKCLYGFRCWLVDTVNFSHWNDTLLVNDYDSLFGLSIAWFNWLELKFLEAMFELDYPLVLTKACFLVGVYIHWIICSLKILKELLTPIKSAMPLNISKHLFHSILLFIWTRLQHFAQIWWDVNYVKWIYHKSSVELFCASRKLRQNYWRLIEALFEILGMDEFKWAEG